MIDKPVAIITGAAGGIGKATVLKFSEKGYVPVLVDHDAEALEAFSSELKSTTREALIIRGDIQEAEFLETIVRDTMEKFGRIDVLINNAAWRSIGTMRDMSLADWDRTVRINLTAPAFLAKYAAREMEKNNRAGVIVNLSSVMSTRASGYAPAYTICKGGMESLTHELAVLYGPSGIRVVCVSPGNVDTAMSSDYIGEGEENISGDLVKEMELQTPLRRSASPAEIADTIWWLASPEASFISGTTITVDGGFSGNFNSYLSKKRLMPREF